MSTHITAVDDVKEFDGNTKKRKTMAFMCASGGAALMVCVTGSEGAGDVGATGVSALMSLLFSLS